MLFSHINIKRFTKLENTVGQIELCEALILIIFLRNHMAQRAIEQAERGGFGEVDRLFELPQSALSKTA